MSKPNTIHIIGFAVKQWSVNAPAVVSLDDNSDYTYPGYVENDYWL